MAKKTKGRKLTAKQRALLQPIVDGSSYTTGQLRRDSGTAANLRYGQAERQGRQDIATARQMGRDTNDFYDAYLKELAQHQTNVAAYQKGAQDQVQSIGTALAGLGSDVPALSTSTEAGQAAKNASGVRQTLMGSFGALMASQGAANNTYADTLSNVVGPGQKLQAQAQAQGRENKAHMSLGDLLKEKGQYRAGYESDARQAEAKNVIAAQGLGLDVAKQGETVRHNRATERNTRQANRSQRRAQNQQVNKYGYSNKDWAAMTVQERQKIIRDFGSNGGKPTDPASDYAKRFFQKYGVKPASQPQVTKAGSQIGEAKSWVKKVAASNPAISRADLAALLTTGQAKDKDSVAIPKLPELWVSVALDLKYLGRISNGTADKLHRAGYSVKQLGLPSGQKATGVKMRDRQPQSGPITSGGDPAGRFK